MHVGVKGLTGVGKGIKEESVIEYMCHEIKKGGNLGTGRVPTRPGVQKWRRIVGEIHKNIV